MDARARIRRLPAMTLLAIVSIVLSGACTASGVLLLNVGYPDDTPTEVGRWLLQVASLFAGTGAVSAVLRRAETVRAERAAWTGLLQDLIAAHDTAQLSSRLLSAHATAMTYRDQMSQVNDVRATIRRLSSAPEVHDDESLSTPLLVMRSYLRRLVEEYQSGYLAVARQQRLDEAVLTYRLGKLAQAAELGRPPLIPPDLEAPLPAGRLLADSLTFPRLSDFRDSYDASEFRRAYELAKDILQARSGIRAARAADTEAP